MYNRSTNVALAGNIRIKTTIDNYLVYNNKKVIFINKNYINLK